MLIKVLSSKIIVRIVKGFSEKMEFTISNSINFNRFQPKLNKDKKSTPDLAIKQTNCDSFFKQNFYFRISFGNKLEEHRNWGAYVKKTNSDNSQEVYFKVWAPKAEKVIVEIRNPEDTISLNEEGIKSENLRDKWAGEWHLKAEPTDEKSTFFELKKNSNNIFSGTTKLPYKNGMYRYLLKDKDGNIYAKTKDPVAKAQPHIFSWSQIYDNKEFQWTDSDWVNGNDKRRVSDLAKKSKEFLKKYGLSATTKDGQSLLKPSNLIVKEIHIPTITEEGNIEALKSEIDKIAEEKIYNGILLMPVEGTYDKNWGYDGVDKYAVSRGLASENGKKDCIYRNNSLKEIINHAHNKGINVGIDWVPSHIFKDGPSGNNLEEFGPYEKPGNWGGRRFNLENEDISVRRNVRDYVGNIPMNWVDNYHIDFLRADQTPEMKSNSAMKQIAQEIRFHFPHTVIHWEDHRTDIGLTNELTEADVPYGDSGRHEKAINSTVLNESPITDIGGNEQWDFGFSHSVEAILCQCYVMGYEPSITTLAQNIRAHNGTKFFMSHDEIGNDSGARLMTKIIRSKLNICDRLDGKYGESQAERIIRGLDTVREMFKAYEFNKENWNNEFYRICNEKGLHNVSIDEMAKIIEQAKAKHKLAIGLLFMAPGSKMIFQGDEYGEINPFRFTRVQAQPEPEIEKEKGYQFDKAFEMSKLDKSNTIKGILKLSQEMSKLVKRNSSLQDIQLSDNMEDLTPLTDKENNVLAIKRFDKTGNEIITLYNFGNEPIHKYKIKDAEKVFNNANWRETINSNSGEFDGTGELLNTEMLNRNYAKINLPANSFVVLEKA